MRVSFLLAMVVAALTVSAAQATDVRLGPTSSGTVRIMVSVAPRAWQTSTGQLCVAAPASGYSLKTSDGASIEGSISGTADCSGTIKAESITLTSAPADNLVIVSAE
jgi:hypothetical protein